MILYVSGRDTDELLMVLEGMKGAVVKRSACVGIIKVPSRAIGRIHYSAKG